MRVLGPAMISNYIFVYVRARACMCVVSPLAYQQLLVHFRKDALNINNL